MLYQVLCQALCLHLQAERNLIFRDRRKPLKFGKACTLAQDHRVTKWQSWTEPRLFWLVGSCSLSATTHLTGLKTTTPNDFTQVLYFSRLQHNLHNLPFSIVPKKDVTVIGINFSWQ